MIVTEAEVASIRGELEIVQRALKLQTRRCRHLVAEYTKRLQEKEQQYLSEKQLRDNQLAKVLRALLIFEARLKQEQKFISHQLNEKDYIIKKQNNDIRKLLSDHYCKNCKTYYSPGSNLESLDSSSEYVVTDYQSSNFESLDSSSETYATLSEKEYNVKEAIDSEMGKNIFLKNKSKDSLGRRAKRIAHRKSIGTYFEVLKLRNDNISPFSNEDNTSNDYDNLDSLPAESVSEKISTVSERIENIFTNNGLDATKKESETNDSSSNLSVSEYNDTVITRNCEIQNVNKNDDDRREIKNNLLNSASKITDTIPVFEGDNETNDNWYASASDQDDEEHRDIYRNNPVLECMNQILLQNINDSMHSPPKTPNVERKAPKNKRVKFSDEEDSKQAENINVVVDNAIEQNDYYETPIQKVPNFYETPQSIYSNDYEQILSKCNESFLEETVNNVKNKEARQSTEFTAKNIELESTESKNNHLYVDMDVKSEEEQPENKLARKSKILRTPPALPPKPANLVSKYKIQPPSSKVVKDTKLQETALDSEPDYCSISELNLPTRKVGKKISVVVEINAPPSTETEPEKSPTKKVYKETENTQTYDPVLVGEVLPGLVARKNSEKFNVQVAKQTSIKKENVSIKPKTETIIVKSKTETEIPKLPQVSEIIIPDEAEPKQQEERISYDNYVKNNSQILKQKHTPRPDQTRHPIMIGSSVSALITGFNNQHILSEINQKQEKPRTNKRMFSNFDTTQNTDKHPNSESNDSLNFDNFDLSQNFEEFKLDDCEIGEDLPTEVDSDTLVDKNEMYNDALLKANSTRVELVRATNDASMPKLNMSSVEQLRKKLEVQRNQQVPNNENTKESLKTSTSPTYEHFLECTGLSSKSILTPSRLLSNHKSMLKPKDVKLRSKVARSSLFESQGNSTIKYWSEPYI